jgi:hypothetical protein
MKVTLESTDKVVELKTATGIVPARLWEGETAGGIRCHAFITRIAVHDSLAATEFEQDLSEQRPVSKELAQLYDSRLVL